LKLIRELTDRLVRLVKPVPIRDGRYAKAKNVRRMSRLLLEANVLK
jgi:hypothetical protein